VLCCDIPAAGELSITKIKDAFAIFKNLVLEARQSGGGGGYTEGGRREPSADDEELQKQIADLKSCLLQRDNEIAILVNMVKKERAGGGGGVDAKAISEEQYRRQQQQREEEEEFAAAKAAMTRRAAGGGRGGPNPQTNPGIMSAAEREALRSEKIIKKHLYGVAPPEDKTIFDDMQGMWQQVTRCMRSNYDANMMMLLHMS
jgi:hypothetical protein